MEPGLITLMDKIINETAAEYMPTVWEYLPTKVRDECVLKALEESPKFLNAFMTDVKEHIEDVFDLKTMVVTKLVENKQLLNDVFQKCGDKELVFVANSGFYFGFLFGLCQMVGWYFYDGGWLLPVCGFVVGYLTNWIALKIIFEPIAPTPIFCGLCGPKFQGLFLTRQDAVSQVFGEINAKEILNTPALWEAILTGPRKQNFLALLRAHAIIFTENLAGGMKPLVVATLGADKFKKMKEDIAVKTMEQLPSIIHHSYEYTDEALQMQRTLTEAMKKLSSAEFEGVLHPVFEEDELKLILVGAALGLGVGLFQLYIMFQPFWVN